MEGGLLLNIALITAGGAGFRMSSRNLPKQFLELHGKPIIIYTLELFEFHPEIDAIVISCLDGWQDYLRNQLERFHIRKVVSVVVGGSSREESIRNGLYELHTRYPEDSIVLVHDAVRPLIDADTITNNIVSVREHGSAITSMPAVETVAVSLDGNRIERILERSQCQIARAPQSFRLGDLYRAYQNAPVEKELVDPASLMIHFGYPLYMVEGPLYNIKITTSSDFYMFRALKDAEENSQILGIGIPAYISELSKYGQDNGENPILTHRKEHSDV